MNEGVRQWPALRRQKLLRDFGGLPAPGNLSQRLTRVRAKWPLGHCLRLNEHLQHSERVLLLKIETKLL